MPRWDQGKPMWEVGSPPPCAEPLLSPSTDEELFRETIAAMERHNVIGVLGGAPDLVATWVAAAPGRFIPGLDVRFDPATGAERAPVPPGAPPQPVTNAARFLRLTLEEIASHHGH